MEILLQFTPSFCQLPKTIYFVEIVAGGRGGKPPTMLRHHRGCVQLTDIVPLASTVATPLVGSDGTGRREPSWGPRTANFDPPRGIISTRVCGNPTMSVRVQFPAISTVPQCWDGGSGRACVAMPMASRTSTPSIRAMRAIRTICGTISELRK